MNNFSFTGNLGRDAEVRQAGSTSVCGFSVPVTSGWGDKKTTTWVNCSLWGKRAEGGLPQYLVKGQEVAITGELSLRTYEKDGVEKSSLDVNVNTLDLIGGSGSNTRQDEKPPVVGDNDSIPF